MLLPIEGIGTKLRRGMGTVYFQTIPTELRPNELGFFSFFSDWKKR